MTCRHLALPVCWLLASALLLAPGPTACAVPAQLASSSAEAEPPVAMVLAPPALLVAGAVDLAPTEQQSGMSRALSSRLERAHYLGLALDDSLSERLLDQYLDFLDPGRAVLLAADAEEFAAFEHTLDDALQEGDLAPAYLIFNRLLERQLSRLEWTIALLEGEDFPESAGLPTGPDELLELDRSDRPWAADAAELDDVWRRRLASELIDLQLSGRTLPEAREQLLERYGNQLRRSAQTTGEDVFLLFMNALTSSYDPHTQYLVPRLAENFDMRMSLSFEGIGALLRPDGEFALVERLIAAGPAEKSGALLPGDRIVGVGQGSEGELVDVIGWRLDDVVQLIRGERGSVVRLSVLPVDAPEGSPPGTIALTRDEVKLEEQSASKELVELERDGRTLSLGIIDLPTFYMDMDAAARGETDFKSATRDVGRLLGELEAEGADGVILDLRGNGGGSLIEAHELAGLLLGRRPIVQVRDADGEVQVLRAAVPAAWTGPLVVLVDRLSASASEIVAAAVQDYGRGLVLGQRTFGKGTVQAVQAAADGRLLLTVAKFYRVTGASTQHRGVAPDLELPAIHDVDAIGESALPGALEWDKIEPQRMRRRNQQELTALLPELQARHDARADADPDLARLEQELSLLREVRSATTVSLDLETRRQEQESFRERRAEIVAAWRAAKGLPAIDEAEIDAEPEVTSDGADEGDDLGGDLFDERELDEETLPDVSAENAPRARPIDAWRQEATEILADLVELFVSADIDAGEETPPAEDESR